MALSLSEANEFIDAGKRISDSVALHLLVTSDLLENVGRWCAFKLQDGTSDNTPYDTKDDAIRHQKGDPKQYCYLKITPDGITPKDAMHFLKINRHPMIDTTAPEHIVNPHIFPRFSNLSNGQKRSLIAQEIEARKNGSYRPTP